MYYSKEDIERARNTDLMDFISAKYGTSFVRQGSYYRCKSEEMSSLIIGRDKKYWFWNSHGYKGKGAIDWLEQVEHMDFTSAVKEILGNTYDAAIIEDNYSSAKKSNTAPDFSSIPKKHYDRSYPAACAYLQNVRGLSPSVVNELVTAGKIYQDTRYNVVFANLDEKGKIAYWTLRGTHEKKFQMNMPGSNNPYYGFEVNSKVSSETLYVFEAPIDLLSHCTIADIKFGQGSWKKDNRLALGGVNDAALESYLARHKDIKTIKFCLDNDKAGISATEKLMKKYYDMGFKTQRIYYGNGIGKDLNEVLCNYLKAEKLMPEATVKPKVKAQDKGTEMNVKDAAVEGKEKG